MAEGQILYLGKEDMREEFIATLTTQFNGQASNRLLLAALQWEKEFYLRIRQELVGEGVIKLGRGRGGTVRVV